MCGTVCQRHHMGVFQWWLSVQFCYWMLMMDILFQLWESSCWSKTGFVFLAAIKNVLLLIAGCTRKTRIIDVVYNASNNELVRTKTLVKSAIILVDSTPFRQWYESHYALPLGRKKGAKLVSMGGNNIGLMLYNVGLSLMITLSSSATECKWCSIRLWGRLDKTKCFALSAKWVHVKLFTRVLVL